MKQTDNFTRRTVTALLTVITALFVFGAATGRAQVATGGSFRLEQTVIAGGGGTSADAGNGFSMTGSIGQPLVDASSGAPFALRSGFFTAPPVAPTAALVTVSGRVMTASGRGIRNVMIEMTDGGGTPRTTLSTSFGYYSFTDVPAGETYIFTVSGKRFDFIEPTRVLYIIDDTSEVDFVAFSN